MSEEILNNEELLPDKSKTVFAEDETLEIAADQVKLLQSSVRTVRTRKADLLQSAVQTLNSEDTHLRLGAVGQANSNAIDAGYAAIGQVKTGDANLKASAVGMVMADDNVSMELSQSKVIFNRGSVTMDHSLAGAVAGRKVKMEDSNVIFLLAGKVEGEVQPLFGPRESILFGIIAGIVGGILVLTGKLFKGLTQENGRKSKFELEDE